MQCDFFQKFIAHRACLQGPNEAKRERSIIMSRTGMELERDCLAIESCLCSRVVDYPPGHIRNSKNRNGTGGVAEEVEHLPGKLEAMNSNPRMTKTK
jgi:hypothetical protein